MNDLVLGNNFRLPQNLFMKQKSFINELKCVIITALEHCEAEGKIKIFSAIAMVSHDDNYFPELCLSPFPLRMRK